MAQTRRDTLRTGNMEGDAANGIIPQTVNPLLQQERDRATLTTDLVSQITYTLDGGRDKTERRHYIESCLFSDPVFNERDRYLRTCAETYDLSVKRSIQLIEFKKRHNITFSEIWHCIYRALSNEVTFGIHDLMFVTFIESQGTEEQKARWLDKARNVQILGTYAQTELGHGTYLPGLETTATYIPSTEEFVLNTPELSSMKWWPGAMGKTSTHVILIAQLIIGERMYGPHAFMLQLRSLKDHSLLPGRKLGVIGEKWNFSGVDNGYLRLDNVRIPRKDMFMKYFQVAPDGTYSRKGNPKVMYTTMMTVRLQIAHESWLSLGRSLVTAVRYSAVRKQGPIERGGPEVVILDYQTQQDKLFPSLTTAYAFNAVSTHLQDIFYKIQAQVARGDFSGLPELHALTCGMKAYTSETAVRFVDTARYACGGHGFLLSSGLPHTFSRLSSSCTYEGENTVMYLQVARYLLKSAQAAVNGRSLAASVAYLAHDTTGQKWPTQASQDLENSRLLIQAFQHKAYRLVNRVAQRMMRLMGQGQSEGVAWNNSTVDLVRAARAHMQLYTVTKFIEVTELLVLDPTVKAILKTLGCLYAIHLMDQCMGDFLDDGYLNSSQAQMVHAKYLDLLATIRPEAVPLVDAFDFSDQTIHSVLGCYDGNVYERLYEHALRDPKNKTEVHETYYKYLRPLLTRNQSKL